MDWINATSDLNMTFLLDFTSADLNHCRNPVPEQLPRGVWCFYSLSGCGSLDPTQCCLEYCDVPLCSKQVHVDPIAVKISKVCQMQHIFDLGLLHLLRIDLQTKLTNYSKINYTCIGFLKSCSREYVTLLALYQEPLTQHLYLRYYKGTSYFIYSITTKLHIHGLVKELEVGKMQLHEYIQHSI